jgi:aryl-alcohol dehydrogenase-like predicted oxidoreductase
MLFNIRICHSITLIHGGEKMDSNIKIFVGTANFGRSYGKAKTKNLFNDRDLKVLLKRVQENDNFYIDTAENYGDSESLIGRHASGILDNKICTKITFNESDTFKSIVKKIENSLRRVKQDSFYSVLIHNSQMIKSKNFLYLVDALNECKKMNLATNVGISCYSFNEISEVFDKTSLLNHFQIPENVADQRNKNNFKLDQINNSGISISIRSVFLQSILLMNVAQIPKFFDPASEVFNSIEFYSHLNEVSKLKYCIDYIRSISWKDGIVFGIENLLQFDQILEALKDPVIVTEFPSKTLNSFYVDPRNW